MKGNNIFYLHIPAYHNQMTSQDMIRQFLESGMGQTLIKNPSSFSNYMNPVLSRFFPTPRQNIQSNNHNGVMLMKYIQYFITNNS